MIWVAVLAQLGGGLGIAWARVAPQGSTHLLDLLPFRDGLGEEARTIPDPASSASQPEAPAAEILDPWANLPRRKASRLAQPRDGDPSDYPSVTEPARIYAPPAEEHSIAELPLLQKPHDEPKGPGLPAEPPQDPLDWIQPALEIVNPWPEAQPSPSVDRIQILDPWASEANFSR